jgi:flagellar basal-body rod modification protein FlgD
MAINPVSTASQQSVAQSSQAKLTGDLKSFLTLLTTQLKHQDPLEPVDSTEFTAQLAQFAAVEQGIQTNSNLEKLINLSLANQSLAAVSYLGKYVEASGDGFSLKNGSGTFAYSLPQTAEGVAIQIKNEAGITVAVKSGETGIGKHTFTWDGKNSQGLQLPDGKYSVVVSAADKDGQPIDAETYTIGIADGADSSGDSIMVTINGINVPLEDVLTVKAAAPGA